MASSHFQPIDLPYPLPHKTIECQGLLQNDDYTYCGHLSLLEKPRVRTRLLTFGGGFCKCFVVLSKGCLYYFKDAFSSSPKGAFSLFGYNLVTRAPIDEPKFKSAWMFNIVHAKQGYHTYKFAADSEKDMQKWMYEVRKEMLVANGKADQVDAFIRDVHGGDGGASTPYSCQKIEHPIYESPEDLNAMLSQCDLIPSRDFMFDDGENDEYSDPDVLDYMKIKPSEQSKPMGKQRSSTLPTNRSIKDSEFHESRSDMKRRPPLPLPSEKPPPLPRLPGYGKTNPDQAPPPPPPPKPSLGPRIPPIGAETIPTVPVKPTLPSKPRLDSPPYVEPIPPTPRRGRMHPIGNVSNTQFSEHYLPMDGPEVKAAQASATAKATEQIASIYFKGSKESAIRTLEEIGETGVYLVRPGTNSKWVLVVYVSGKTKKYVIEELQMPNKKYTIGKDTFDSVEELVRFYTQEPLPTINNVCLTVPYKQRARYV
ncbi:uncharacterized protein LOC141900273 isoform X2 [Tubulanus polymorphus]|uniref:uncharacterized protein LOC141900273 isoform X2 n=1 Tax=Tubulanus polymorphus TaxID=672921 RepID=UPI003DA208B8